VPGNNDEPNALSQFVLTPANNFSQAASNAIANDRATHAT
jgi:hypothetical protein